MSVSPPEPPALQSAQSADALYGRIVTRGRRLRRERWAFFATAGTAVIILAAAIPIALSSDGGERVATTDQPQTTHPAPVTTVTTTPLTADPGVLSATTTTLAPVAVAGEVTTPTTRRPAVRPASPTTTRRPNPATTSPPDTSSPTTSPPSTAAPSVPPSPPATACTPTSPQQALAPNRVLFVRDGDIWAVDPAVQPTVPTNLTNTPGAAEAAPAWSPDRTRIAFVRDGNLFAMTAAGTDPLQVAGQVDAANPPAWSWDGQTIAFVHDGDIWMVSRDGGPTQRAIDVTERLGSPTWSPDGCRLAFTWQGNILTARSDGSGMFKVRSAASEPSWGSNNLIAFSAIVGNVRDVFTVKPDGTGFARLTSNGGSNASWSRDAGQIAFQRSVSGQPDIYTQPASFGATATPVASDPAAEVDPAW